MDKLFLKNYLYFLPVFIFLSIFIYSSCGIKTETTKESFEHDVFNLEIASGSLNNSLDFSNPQKLKFSFGSSFTVFPNSSLEIAYTFNTIPSENIKKNYILTLETDTHSWTLPMDLSFLGINLTSGALIHYAIPVQNNFNGRFNITLTKKGSESITGSKPVLNIQSIQLVNQWYGFAQEGQKYFASPFVSRRNNGSYAILTPNISPQAANYSFELAVSLKEGGQNAAVEIDARRFTAFASADRIFIPSSLIRGRMPVIIFGDRISSFKLSHSPLGAFPIPIKADPGLVLDLPRESWRNSSWEIFKWDRFPSLLMLDTANYNIQNRLLKRLAFFVEKAGFRGTLPHDEEIADLHGWNAHDYKAEDLARFFDAAKKANFPLLTEERVLESVLLNEGIIIKKGNDIVSGTGGIMSISRQTQSTLRRTFMAHEGFHGLFFIDEDFREFNKGRWENFDETARTFFLAFLDFKIYDTADEFLVLKEFKGHILQQPVARIRGYFSRNLPSLLVDTEYSDALPPKDDLTNSWQVLADPFFMEGEAFSDYVNKRWGLAAGRVWTIAID